MAKFSNPTSTDGVLETAVCVRVFSKRRGKGDFSSPAQLELLMDSAVAQGLAVTELAMALGLANHVKKQLA
jgi:hypothetical protein